ncbi:hypothetical protein [Diplocloster hominis]|uniref:hypothetical protein n=1 Tax=Diplocloster hominis TaxID=3079010 RepID=UPI0031BA6CCB
MIPLQLKDPGILTVEATRFRAPLLKVQLDEKDAQRIAYSPYRVRPASSRPRSLPWPG